MKMNSNEYNRISGIKTSKVIIIVFFILAGTSSSLFSNRDVSTKTHNEGLKIEVCLNDYSIGKMVDRKEYKCSLGLEISANDDVSKSITQIYNQLKSTVNKMLNT